MKHDNRGITLAELMVALAISMIVITGATVLLSNSQNNYKYENVRINLQQEAQLASGHITTLLQQASSTDLSIDPVHGKTLWIYGTPQVSGASITTDVSQVYRDGQKLYLSRGASDSAIGLHFDYADQILADYVEGFDYSETVPNPASGRILGRLSLSFQNGGGTFRLEDAVMLRNSAGH